MIFVTIAATIAAILSAAAAYFTCKSQTNSDTSDTVEVSTGTGLTTYGVANIAMTSGQIQYVIAVLVIVVFVMLLFKVLDI